MSSDDKLKEIYGNSNYPKWWINMDEQNTKKEKHIVKDTRKRSVFKALTGRALEISIGTFVISFFILQDLEKSLLIAVLNEGLCAIVSYFNDRVWNLTQFGRKIKHG